VPVASAKGLTVYLAAPLFTQAERDWNRRLAEGIAGLLGSSLILPQDFPIPEDADADGRHRELFRLCVAGVDAADAVIAVLDGPDVDSGTAFEVGYAYARGKIIIGVRTDFRKSQDQGTNLMLARSCHALVQHPSLAHDLPALAAEVARRIQDHLPTLRATNRTTG
jgi:nucleoside 2-deoxyribosyltransferase